MLAEFTPTENPANLDNQQLLAYLREIQQQSGQNREAIETKCPFLIFKLGGSWFGLEATTVRSIARLNKISRVPFTREYVLGIVSLQGNITTALDLRSVLGLEQTGLGKEARLIVVASGELEAGIVADVVAEVVELSESLMQPPLLTSKNANYLKGYFELNDLTVTVLNGAAILNELRV